MNTRRFLQGNVIAVESAISALQPPPPQQQGPAAVSRAPGGHFVFAGLVGSATPQFKADTKRKAATQRPTGPQAANATAPPSTSATINLATSDDEPEEDFLVSPPPSKKKAKTPSKVKFYAIYNGSRIGVCRGPWDRPGGPKELTFGYPAPACQSSIRLKRPSKLTIATVPSPMLSDSLFRSAAVLPMFCNTCCVVSLV